MHSCLHSCSSTISKLLAATLESIHCSALAAPCPLKLMYRVRRSLVLTLEHTGARTKVVLLCTQCQDSTDVAALTLLPVSTIGMFSHTLVKSLCQYGTFLYVILRSKNNSVTTHILGQYTQRVTAASSSYKRQEMLPHELLLPCAVWSIGPQQHHTDLASKATHNVLLRLPTEGCSMQLLLKLCQRAGAAYVRSCAPT
jgi:hypothetical protein